MRAAPLRPELSTLNEHGETSVHRPHLDPGAPTQLRDRWPGASTGVVGAIGDREQHETRRAFGPRALQHPLDGPHAHVRWAISIAMPHRDAARRAHTVAHMRAPAGGYTPVHAGPHQPREPVTSCGPSHEHGRPARLDPSINISRAEPPRAAVRAAQPIRQQRAGISGASDGALRAARPCSCVTRGEPDRLCPLHARDFR